MKTEREYNYDLLRVISMFAVIVVHASAIWVKGFSAYIAQGGELIELTHPISACVYNTITRFAVPCFIMLSGAFILDDEKTIHYKEFYSKKLMKIGIPTLIFTLLYVLYRVLTCLIWGPHDLTNLIRLITDIMRGSPFNHMWYLYMLIGVYLLAPVVMCFKNSISYESFRKVAYIFLVVAGLSNWTGIVRMNWDLGQSFEYLGCFMVGYVVRKDFRKNNIKGIMLILLGVAIEILMALIEYEIMIKRGIAESDLIFGIVNPYSPPIVLSSVLIFAGFTALHIQYHRWIEKLAGMSFLIYLFHSGVNDFMEKLITRIKGNDYILMNLNNLYWIPIFAMVVFVISYVLTVIYRGCERNRMKRG